MCVYCIFIHSSIDGYLGYFPILVIVNDYAVYMEEPAILT